MRQVSLLFRKMATSLLLPMPHTKDVRLVARVPTAMELLLLSSYLTATSADRPLPRTDREAIAVAARLMNEDPQFGRHMACILHRSARTVRGGFLKYRSTVAQILSPPSFLARW